jgi:hypothetical protein
MMIAVGNETENGCRGLPLSRDHLMFGIGDCGTCLTALLGVATWTLNASVLGAVVVVMA